MDNKYKPAYPRIYEFGSSQNNDFENEPGLTKREELAKAAMQGILSNHWCQMDFNKEIKALGYDEVAKQAVGYADALLAELEKQ